MLKLSNIQDTIETITDAIASVINMEVMICDNDYKRIGDSDKEWRPKDLFLSRHSVLKQVMESGKPLVLKQRSKNKGCIACEHSYYCKISALIGVPIKHNDIVLGAIEIVADSEDNKETILDKSSYIISFLDKMSDLIVSKLLEKETAEKFNVIREQLISIMDSIGDGIIALDKDGYIVYQNSHFEKLFKKTLSDSEKLNIKNLIPQNYILDLVEKGVQFRNRELNISRNSIEYYTLVSGKPIKLQERNIGAILTFKKM